MPDKLPVVTSLDLLDLERHRNDCCKYCFPLCYDPYLDRPQTEEVDAEFDEMYSRFWDTFRERKHENMG
jgi:hypothetical protein